MSCKKVLKGQCWSYKGNFYDIKEVYWSWARVEYLDHNYVPHKKVMLVNELIKGELMPF